MKSIRSLFAGLSVALASSLALADTCAPDTFSSAQNNVLGAYVAYYGRPADHGGLTYWASRMAQEGGSLSSIIQAFGESAEFTDRYGGRSSQDLVAGIFQQLFGRAPDAAGLAYYTGELSAGRRSLQSIALDVMFGAQGTDATIITQRLAAARHFTTGAAAPAIAPERFDADAMSAILASVGATPASRDRACLGYSALLSTVGGLAYTKHITVNTTADANNGRCSATCGLRDAVNEANATAGPVLITLPAGTYTLTHAEADLFVTGNIHLQGDGRGKTVIDGNGQTRLFWLESTSARLVLSSLALRNGRYSYGGAILSKGTLILDRVDLLDNVTPTNGGAVLSTGSVYSFSSQFARNQATGTGFGAALLNEGGSAHLYANTFTGNRAAHSGGGIYSSGSVLAAHSTFTANTAGANGGGIEATGQTALATVVGSVFSQNVANDGGAVSLHDGGSLVAESTLFSDNRANGVDLGGGGAVFSYNGTIDLAGTDFTANIADGEGGGAIQNRGKLTIRDSNFDNNLARVHHTPLANSADGFGGAILLIEGSVTDITRTTFSANIAGNTGGALYNDLRTTLTVSDSLLHGNAAQGLFSGGPGGYGGAIHNEGMLRLIDTTLSANQAKEAGGALSLNQIADVTATRVTIVDNSASHGGGIVAYTGTLALVDSSVARNRATKAGDGFGGALLNDAATSTVQNSFVQNNQAAIGGGFSNNGGGTVRLFSSSLDGNTASVDGSAFINFTNGRVELRNSVIAGTFKNHPGSVFQDLGGNTYQP
jgi:CSLREA domain-containing protein